MERQTKLNVDQDPNQNNTLATKSVDQINFVLHSQKPPFKEVNRIAASKDHFEYATTTYDRRGETEQVNTISCAVMVKTGSNSKTPCKIVKLMH